MRNHKNVSDQQKSGDDTEPHLKKKLTEQFRSNYNMVFTES
jgi:hypothetical protein